MQARTRFMLAVVVLFLLMTGPFLLTALIVWVETAGEAREMLVKVLSPHLTLGTLLTAMGFAAGSPVAIREPASAGNEPGMPRPSAW